MKKIIVALAAAGMLLAVAPSCQKISDLEARMDSVETSVADIQKAVKDLQAKVDSKVYVTEVKPTDNGYTIKFTDGTTANIVNGAKGDKGDKGDTGAKGDKGDKGDTGDSYFADVKVTNTAVEVTFADGTKVVLPVYTVEVSSVVFVPDYADGCAHVETAPNYCSALAINYLIYPEGAAKNLAEGIKNGAYKAYLVPNKLTKASDGTAQEVPGAAISASENGTVFTLNLDAASAEKLAAEYGSFALRLDNTVSGHQILSAFTTLKADAIKCEIGGVSYGFALMKDGKFWMTENLRYVPEGFTPSDDVTNVTAGVYYPVVFDTAANATAFSKADADIKARGYLYQTEAALGVKVGDITADNAASFEGAQGICPDGWHIPTIADITGLVGKAVSPIVTNAQAPYYNGSNGSIAMLNADGMNMDAYGAVTLANTTATKATLMGKLSTYTKTSSGYFVGSTFAKAATNNLQFYGLMPMTNKATEAEYTCNGSMLGFRTGASVRCVKND